MLTAATPRPLVPDILSIGAEQFVHRTNRDPNNPCNDCSP
jgi:hypothetical protein